MMSPTTKGLSPMNSPSSKSSQVSSESYQALFAFKKAAKKDSSAFETLKDEQYYNTFQSNRENFILTSKAQQATQ